MCIRDRMIETFAVLDSCLPAEEMKAGAFGGGDPCSRGNRIFFAQLMTPGGASSRPEWQRRPPWLCHFIVLYERNRWGGVRTRVLVLRRGARVSCSFNTSTNCSSLCLHDMKSTSECGQNIPVLHYGTTLVCITRAYISRG